MNLPEPGTEAVYRGLNVVVTTVKKRGRGYQVHYTTLDGQAHIAELTGAPLGAPGARQPFARPVE